MNKSTSQHRHLLNILKTTLFFLFCVNTTVFGQFGISGIVLDSEKQNPISDATVYINGTTTGVSTNASGSFTLTGVVFPCKLVVSRVGYDLKTLTLSVYSAEKLSILLKEKIIQLSTVEVTGKNSRNINVENFRKYFLGSDEWSKKTLLKNEEVLLFKSYSDTIIEKPDTTDYLVLRAENNDLTKSDTIIEPKVFHIFSVKAQAPIKVDFPTLGYKVSIDLVSFYLIKSRINTVCKYRAYYYFQPYETKNKIVERRYQKNRQEAFNNSREHFCRTLFNNRLKENGYLVVPESESENSNNVQKQFINLNDFIIYKNDKVAKIVGLKGKTFFIYSFYNYANKPMDMSKPKEYKYKSVDDFWQAHYSNLNNKSSISFTGDTCTITSDGTIFDDNIMFGGKMIKKKVDALIPDIYIKNE